MRKKTFVQEHRGIFLDDRIDGNGGDATVLEMTPLTGVIREGRPFFFVVMQQDGDEGVRNLESTFDHRQVHVVRYEMVRKRHDERQRRLSKRVRFEKFDDGRHGRIVDGHHRERISIVENTFEHVGHDRSVRRSNVVVTVVTVETYGMFDVGNVPTCRVKRLETRSERFGRISVVAFSFERSMNPKKRVENFIERDRCCGRRCVRRRRRPVRDGKFGKSDGEFARVFAFGDETGTYETLVEKKIRQLGEMYYAMQRREHPIVSIVRHVVRHDVVRSFSHLSYFLFEERTSTRQKRYQFIGREFSREFSSTYEMAYVGQRVELRA